jgi:hypothetical protein
MVTAIDMNPDLATLKHDWKQEHRVDNVIKLKVEGQQHFLKYMREKAGAAFPY